MGRTALHFAAAIKDKGNLYNFLKDAGADEAITDLVKCGISSPHVYY